MELSAKLYQAINQYKSMWWLNLLHSCSAKMWLGQNNTIITSKIKLHLLSMSLLIPIESAHMTISLSLFQYKKVFISIQISFQINTNNSLHQFISLYANTKMFYDKKKFFVFTIFQSILILHLLFLANIKVHLLLSWAF